MIYSSLAEIISIQCIFGCRFFSFAFALFIFGRANHSRLMNTNKIIGIISYNSYEFTILIDSKHDRWPNVGKNSCSEMGKENEMTRKLNCVCYFNCQ